MYGSCWTTYAVCLALLHCAVSLLCYSSNMHEQSFWLHVYADMNIEDVGRPPKPEPESDGEDALMAVVKEEPSDPVEPESIELPESTEANESTPAITELPDPFAGLPHQEGLVPVVIHHRQVGLTLYQNHKVFLSPSRLPPPPPPLLSPHTYIWRTTHRLGLALHGARGLSYT